MTQQNKLKLIRYLNFICIFEASKPLEEMNEELIDACVTVLLDLQDKHVELSPEYVNEKVRKIFHTEEKEATEPETVKVPKKVVNKKKIWLVAACIAILVALFSIISFSSERSVVDILEDFLGTYEFIPFGKEVNVGEESYIKEEKAKQYNTISEAAKKEKTILLFPKNRMYTDTLKRISASSYENKRNLIITFDDPTFSINIILNANLSKDITSICDEKITYNDIDFYLCSMNDIAQVQAYFTYNDNLYTVTYSDRDSLIDILENMEEIKYED